jgi:TRAP-type C4-dicarboxylate transport system permease small subunit
MFGAIKSAIIAFIVAVIGFVAFHILYHPGGSSDPRGVQALMYASIPLSGLIAGIIFVIAWISKATARDED